MKHSLGILLILLLLSGRSIGQRILSQYDFNAGGYYICLLEGPIGKDRGIPPCPVPEKFAIDTTTFFYTSDTVVLNRLKKEILLYKRRPKNGIDFMYLCGYPFWFCVFREGKLLLKLPANLECEYMSTSMGQLIYHSKTLKQYSKIFKPLILRNTCFNSEREMIDFIDKIRKDSSYVSYKQFGRLSYSSAFLIETIQLW
jgi:hypothetical protein